MDRPIPSGRNQCGVLWVHDMVKMAKRPHEDLIEFLQATLEDKLRDVVMFEPRGHEILFVRNEADRRAVDNAPETRTKRGDPPGSGREQNPRVTAHDGPLDCRIGITETVIVVVFYPTADVEIRVSFERDTNLTLQPFIEECLAILR